MTSKWTILLLALFSFNAFAEQGFFRLDDPSIPAAVRAAADSVYRLEVPDDESHLPKVVIDMETEAKKYQKKWDDDSLEASQLRFCQRTNLRYCPIFDAVGKGTAFLVENDRQIFSVLHNFNDFFGVQIQKQDLIDRNEIRKVIRNIPIPMLMTRNDESLAFTSKDNTALMDLFNPDTRLFDVKFGNNAFMFKLSDLVSLNVASAMPDRPLKIATRLPEVGDVVYGLGYPRKTKDRHSTFGTEDSDGKQIWVSKGHVISTAEWARRIDPDMPPLVKLAYDAYMIMTDFDVEHGDSGGPILNEQGEVVGVIQAMYPDLTTPHQILSGGLKIFSEPKLNKLWDMFQ